MRARAIAAALMSACASLFLGGPAAADGVIHPAVYVARQGDVTFYLYGTLHTRQPGADWGGPEARAALAQSNEVWTELEISPSADRRALLAFQRRGMSGQSLRSRLTQEQRQRLEASLRESNRHIETIDNLQPWLASLTMSLWPVLDAGYSPSNGADHQIDRVASAQRKRMRWFETAQMQVDRYARLSEAEQIEMLMTAAETTQAVRRGLGPLDTLWESGDEAALQQVFGRSDPTEDPEIYQATFAQRNVRWADTLAQQTRPGEIDFVAVGAAHLYGPDGLIALLRARGYDVQRFTPAPAG